MRKKLQLVGNRFGRWTVIEEAEMKNGRTMWLCRCDCGNERIIKGASLRYGESASCGCTRQENFFEKDKKLKLAGQRFGRLTVVEEVDKKPLPGSWWLCKCDCGKESIVIGKSLTHGSISSCGCWNREKIAKSNTKHGLCDARLYKIWIGMKTRCYYSNCEEYHNYGGRGISICDEWLHDFKAFYDWSMANGYDKNARRGECTIDRINVNGNYEPSNCRWASMSVQNANRRIKKSHKTGCVGVKLHSKEKRYTANICVNYRRIYLGYYKTLDEAIAARKAAEAKYWGKAE